MNFFRNPEIRRSLILHTVVTVCATAAAGFFGYVFSHSQNNASAGVLYSSFYGMSPAAICALLVLALCLIFTGMHLIITWLRYRKIQKLSQEIDQVLHGADTLRFSDYKEGELSILKIEIDKMLLRMREQSDALKEDKSYLAASMADISHQIRTPLTSIHLVLSLLSESELSQERRLELVQQLDMLISRIDWLIEALLKISRLDAGTVVFKTQHVPLAQVIRLAYAPLEIPMELREQTFTFTAETRRESILADLAWTVEAISNILKNCMEHTPQGGNIHVTATQNAIYTELVIEDDGPGFDKADLPHLFERFYKGKGSGEQSIGIGLALARMILARQNATIKAENRTEGGARFVIHFYQDTTV
jgi:signal transduction histidine kinase